MRGDATLARFEEYGVDMPWFLCSFEPTPEFAQVEPLFQQQERALEAEDWDAAERVWQQMSSRMTLVPDDAPEGQAIEYLIRLDGDRARLRYETL
jgi:hypothetical protein